MIIINESIINLHIFVSYILILILDERICEREADVISAVVVQVKIFNYDVWNMQSTCFRSGADDQISRCKRNLSLAYQNGHLWF